MKFEKYIEEYGLEIEKNAKFAAQDLSRFKCSISKGVLSINPAVVEELGLDKKHPYIEFFIGKQGNAVIFGVKGGAHKEYETAVKVKVLKTKPTKINISRLLIKHGLSTNKDYMVDLMDCGKWYLLFAVIPPTAPEPKREVSKTVEKEEKKYHGSGIVGAQESVLTGSDF